MKNMNWKDVKLSILGKEIDFKPINYMSKDDVVLASAIEIDIDALRKITSNEFIITNSREGKSIVVDGIEIKVDSRIYFDENEYLVEAVLEDKVILELISRKL